MQKPASLPNVNIYHDLFQELDRQSVDWCSWKSNEHLAEGLDGRTDLDLLFYECDRTKVTKVLRQFGFILFRAPAYRSYPGVIDYISVDINNGRILHIHAHFLLTLGEKNLKSYVFPWNDIILKNKIPSDIADNIYIASPDIEMVSLLIRESVKIRWRDLTKAKIKKSSFGGKGFWQEFNWLKERITSEYILTFSIDLSDEKTAQLIQEIIDTKPSFTNMGTLKSHIHSIAIERDWKRMSSRFSIYCAWKNEITNILTRIAEKIRFNQTYIIRRRVIPNEGLIVAFMGADGSGKSTVTQQIISDWQHKIDIQHIYFGTGDGQTSLLIKFIKSLFSVKKLLTKKKENSASDQSDNVVDTGKRPSLSTVVMAVAGVLQKKSLIKHTKKLKRRGYLVICDRWPQNQILGINDGPLLSGLKDSKNNFLRMIANWEEKKFQDIVSYQQPDLVLKLVTSVETAVSRKEENKKVIQLIEKKIENVTKINFSDVTRTITINADQDLDFVLREARQSIWDAMLSIEPVKYHYYESIGLPGAGKTSFCDLIYKENKLISAQSIYYPIDKKDKISLMIKSIFSEFMLYARILKLVFKYNLWTKKEALSHLLKLPVQKLRLQQALDGKTYLSDQLFLQNIWSAFVSAKVFKVRPYDLAPLIKALYKDINSKVLFFKISPEISAERIFDRTDGNSRFDGLSKEDILIQLNSLDHLMDNIATAASYAGLEVVSIDAQQEIEEVKKDIESVFD